MSALLLISVELFATIFMMTNVSVQDWAARDLGSLRGIVYSLHKCTIPLGPSASSVMKYCPLSTVFKTALEHVWITSERRTIVRIVVWAFSENSIITFSAVLSKTPSRLSE